MYLLSTMLHVMPALRFLHLFGALVVRFLRNECYAYVARKWRVMATTLLITVLAVWLSSKNTHGVSHHQFLTLAEQEKHTHHFHKVPLGALHTIYDGTAVVFNATISESTK